MHTGNGGRGQRACGEEDCCLHDDRGRSGLMVDCTWTMQLERMMERCGGRAVVVTWEAGAA